MKLHRAALFGVSLLLAGCGFFDSGVIWRAGPYVLGWIDLPEEVTLSYDRGNGALVPRIDAQVFAVGWDGRYLVAKQQPGGNREITCFFIIEVGKDGPEAELKSVVSGPLSEVEFGRKSVELGLPPFSKELGSLKE